MKARIPEAFEDLFTPSRYKIWYGGRGGAKSWSFADALLIKALRNRTKILCARELQNSIADSVHSLLCSQIDRLGMGLYYDTTQSQIRCVSGSVFIFSGLRFNPKRLKSMEDIDICWVEEAETVSEDSWKLLTPTIRKPGSEIWVTFNPDLETDPAYKRFVKNPPPNSIVRKVGWEDNPWITEELLAEKAHLYSVDPDAADHVWGGNTRRHSKAEILAGKYCVEPFEPEEDWAGPYYGADWGFAQDPVALVRCWVSGDPQYLNHTLWIEHEAGGIGIDNDELPQLFDSVPGTREHTCYADSARPETISHMRKHGFDRMKPCKKWDGSVKDGIAHLRGYNRIVIHPRCKRWLNEAQHYKYKSDRLTGEVLPVIVDANNHFIDATRYALGPLIRHEDNSISVI